MKKLKKLFLITLCLVSISGCTITDKLSASIDGFKNTTGEKISNVKEKTDKIKSNISEAKENIDQKIEDVKTATREVNEAIDQIGEASEAIGNVVNGTEEEKTTSAGTGETVEELEN